MKLPNKTNKTEVSRVEMLLHIQGGGGGGHDRLWNCNGYRYLILWISIKEHPPPKKKKKKKKKLQIVL